MKKEKNSIYKQKALMIVTGVCLAFILIEVGLRLMGGCIMVVQELRNKAAVKDSNTYRIMCLGESTTADGYPQILEEILNTKASDRRFGVVNKGIGGVNTNIIVAELKKNLDEYAPDMVIVMMGINDNRADIFWHDNKKGNKVSSFLIKFKTYRLAKLLNMHSKINRLEKKMREKDKLAQVIDTDNRTGEMKGLTALEILQICKQYFQQGKYVEVKEMLEPEIESLLLENDLREASFLLAGSYRFCGQINKAIEMYKNSIAWGNTSDELYRQLGNCFRHAEMFDQAEASIKQAIKINNNNVNAYYELGLCYLKQNKFDEAQDNFLYVLEAAPDHFAAYHDLMGIYSKEKKYNTAINLSHEVLKKSPADARIFGILAQLYLSKGEQGMAEKFFTFAGEIRGKEKSVDTFINYKKLHTILSARGIRLVCVQYPLRKVRELQDMFLFTENVIFVDNETIFKEALKKYSYEELFTDRFGGEFGHCTLKGKEILAENIAKSILSYL